MVWAERRTIPRLLCGVWGLLALASNSKELWTCERFTSPHVAPALRPPGFFYAFTSSGRWLAEQSEIHLGFMMPIFYSFGHCNWKFSPLTRCEVANGYLTSQHECILPHATLTFHVAPSDRFRKIKGERPCWILEYFETRSKRVSIRCD